MKVIAIISVTIIIIQKLLKENDNNKQIESISSNDSKSINYQNNKRKFNDENDIKNKTTNNEVTKENISNPEKKSKILSIKLNNPLNYEEAIDSHDSKQWKQAIDKELNNTYNQRVMKIINKIPHNATLIDGMWIFTTKDDGTKKARWVAKGFKQKEGINYTYSPTVQADGLRITIAIAARYNWNLKQIRYKGSLFECKIKRKNLHENSKRR
jgi:hypothetical protein